MINYSYYTEMTPKSYMKPPAKRVTIQKPEPKLKAGTPSISLDGFTRINDSKIRKVYK